MSQQLLCLTGYQKVEETSAMGNSVVLNLRQQNITVVSNIIEAHILEYLNIRKLEHSESSDSI